MNEYYTLEQLRHVEGASQRIEDTMHFATIVEDLGVELIKSCWFSLPFYRYCSNFRKEVPVLPVVGEIKHSLVWAAGLTIIGYDYFNVCRAKTTRLAI